SGGGSARLSGAVGSGADRGGSQGLGSGGKSPHGVRGERTIGRSFARSVPERLPLETGREPVEGRPKTGAQEGAHDGRSPVLGVLERETDDDEKDDGGNGGQRRHGPDAERDAIGAAQGGLAPAQQDQR